MAKSLPILGMLKEHARRLVQYLGEHHRFTLKDSGSLEGVAFMCGERDWNTLHAKALALDRKLERHGPGSALRATRESSGALQQALNDLDSVLERLDSFTAGAPFTHVAPVTRRAAEPDERRVRVTLDAMILEGDPDTVTSRLMTLLPSAESNPGADFYRQQANYALTVFIDALQAANRDYTVMDVAILLQSAAAVEKVEALVPEDSLASKALRMFLDSLRERDNSSLSIKRLKNVMGGMGGRIALLAQAMNSRPRLFAGLAED
jgi:hypothetical protein